MEQRVPDEYFRPAAESDDVRGAEAGRISSVRAAVRAVAPSDVGYGLTLRTVAILAVVALGLSFAVGRFWLFPPGEQVVPDPTPPPTIASTPSASTSPDAASPYSGAVAAVQAVSAEGRCAEGGSRDAPLALVDNNSDTIWRCRGNGAEERVTVHFPGTRTLVGLRVVNGNTVWTARYLEERRILAIRWTFSDGSFFDQGLAANNRNAQEVRFPKVVTDQVTLTILESTAPGGTSVSMDAVSISTLEFLAPA